MDRPCRSDGTAGQMDGTAGQMDGEAGWWTTSGKIGVPPFPLARSWVWVDNNNNVSCVYNEIHEVIVVNHSIGKSYDITTAKVSRKFV